MKTILNGKVVNSPNHRYYSLWLRNGTSCAECSRRAKELFNEEISPDAFENYKRSLNPDSLVPQFLPFADFDLLIDEEKHLMQLILIQEKRIKKLSEREETMPLPLSVVDGMIAQLSDMLVKLATIRGKASSQLNLRTAINQQFSGFIPSDNKDKIVNSPDELDRWFNELIQGANTNSGKTRDLPDGVVERVPADVNNQLIS